MMSSKDRVGQIIKAFITVVTLITLTSRFCIIKAAFDHMLRLTRGTCDAVGPAQLTNGLITLHVINEMLDVNLHDWTPVRDRKMGWRQYTPSSNATTPESNKSVAKNVPCLGAPVPLDNPDSLAMPTLQEHLPDSAG